MVHSATPSAPRFSDGRGEVSTVSQPDLRTRKATTADVESIVAMNAEMAREMEGKALDLSRLGKGVAAVVGSPDDRLGFYVVAEVSGEAVGVMHVTYEWSPWRNATFWWLANVFVRNEWRRRGVYRAMHEFVEARAAKDPGRRRTGSTTSCRRRSSARWTTSSEARAARPRS